MSNTLLSCVKIGEIRRVANISDDNPELKSRLYALGVIPGCEIRILRSAPLGDPLQLKVGSSFISIRKAEAAIIETEIALQRP